jgi:hypothetical protein
MYSYPIMPPPKKVSRRVLFFEGGGGKGLRGLEGI